jgi:uncharacterized protein YkwD
VPAARSHLATTLSALCCAACAFFVTLLVASSATARGERSRTDCVRNARNGGTTTHLCRPTARNLKSRQPKAAKLHVAKTRPTRSSTKAAPTPTPLSEPTVAAAQPSLSEHAAATIAAVLATTCPNTELTPEAANIDLVRAAVLCLINRKRAENGEAPLKTSPQLEEAAEGHCEELIADDYFAHVSPSGETPVDRIRDTGYIPNANVGYVIGENLAWGTYQLSTPASIVAAWIASPGHLANILEAKYAETGIGVTPAVPSSLAAGAPGATYAQEFGVIVQ